jgi:hypothetical protein
MGFLKAQLTALLNGTEIMSGTVWKCLGVPAKQMTLGVEMTGEPKFGLRHVALALTLA